MEAATDIRAFYARRRSDLESRRDAVVRQVHRVGNARLVAFLATIVAGVYAVRSGASVSSWLTAIAFSAFVALVWRGRSIRRDLRQLDDRLTITHRATSRLSRDWDALPARSWDVPDTTHPYSSDLDVVGEASLMQLFPTLSRAPGDSTLASWLLRPADVDIAKARQDAVRELVPLPDFREALELQGMRATVTPASLGRLSDWATRAPSASPAASLPFVGATLAVATIAGIVAQVVGAVAAPIWLLPLIAGAIVSKRFAPNAAGMFADVRGHAPLLRRYDAIIAVIEAQPFDAPMLRAVRDELSGDTTTARRAIRSLARLSDCADVRHSPMLHAIVNALFLWDLQIASLLARWQAANGRRVAPWLNAIGTIEALAALASLAHDNPGWTFPQLSGAESDTIDARTLGHPLLPPEVCIGNDVSVGPRGTVLLISGSNMSGKSTLLRAIGANVVLAQAGSAVCATEMRCPRLDMHTSMRVADSLRHGVSRFMAELLRIKTVVDAADASAHGGPLVLYLLDELLQGTNSVERAIAAQRVVEHLAASGAIGVVTTHDLALLDTPDLQSRVRNAHFREQLAPSSSNGGDATMSFDYVLRPGTATSRNALALLTLLGVRPR